MTIQTDSLAIGAGRSVTGASELTIISTTNGKDVVMGGAGETLLSANTVAALNGYAGRLNLGGNETNTTATTFGNLTVSAPLTTTNQIVLFSRGDVLFDGNAGGRVVAPNIAVIATGTSNITGYIRDNNPGSSLSPSTPIVLEAAESLVLLANIQVGEDGIGGDKLNVDAANLDIRQFTDFEGVENRRFAFG